jgi:hypothetical protein
VSRRERERQNLTPPHKYSRWKFQIVITSINPPRNGAMPNLTIVADVKVEIRSPLLDGKYLAMVALATGIKMAVANPW